ncbi:hypothetical protein J7T55_006253 [Diaporthe amygdali]|uniref:uncharacterized protein n=1 Tax=Phomopsis amygdali TaxID=1214568 RepID=UPI0022FE0C3D|nr:uncharacterized protein J7T55_006253 [Diaporthe amygdali]KAJ0124910.1 hypothetical protein J7T55_006253 [Diaporthe amygdali]
MGFPLILALRAVQGVFAVIILGLSAYVANWYNVDTLTSSPSQVNFLVFVPLFSLISIAYLEAVPKFMPKLSHPWAVLALEVTNVLFYFAGFVALAVFLTHLLFCRGAVCGSARAATVFSSFNFVLWTATAALTIKDALKGGFAGLRMGHEGGRYGRINAYYGSDGRGSFFGYVPATPPHKTASLEVTVKKLSSWDHRRSTVASSEEWEIATFVGSEEEVVAGKGYGRRDTW